MGLLARIDRQRAIPVNLQTTTQAVSNWWSTIHEPFTGAWQMNVTEETRQTLLKFPAIYSCVTGISRDISKMPWNLMKEDDDEIWNKIRSGSPWLPVLRKPNHFQIPLEFVDSWVTSLLIHGNTYVLKERDQRGIVNRMYVLEPTRVIQLVASDGAVYYELKLDYLSGINEDFLQDLINRYGRVAVPASEIIHDKMTPLWHQLVGVSPLYAAALAGTMGRRIQDDSTQFFSNAALPGGIITGPARISDPAALRLKTAFEANFGGANRGKIAVLGDNLQFTPMRQNADNSQVDEQYRNVIEDVARAFHYPMWKLGGPMPPYTHPDVAQTQYYQDCLHPIVQSIEGHLFDGLSLPLGTEVWFDEEELMRMDIGALIKSNNDASDWMETNEQRKRFNLRKTKGGDAVYKQQQEHSLAALEKRDNRPDPFSTSPAPAPEPPAPKAATPPEPARAAEPSEEQINAMLSKLETYMRSDMALR